MQHTYDNFHTFNWTETQLLGREQTKHAREFKEHGTVQTVIRLMDTLTCTIVQSAYNLSYIGALRIKTLI